MKKKIYIFLFIIFFPISIGCTGAQSQKINLFTSSGARVTSEFATEKKKKRNYLHIKTGQSVTRLFPLYFFFFVFLSILKKLRPL